MSWEPVKDAVEGIEALIERGAIVNLCPHPVRVAVGYYCWIGEPEEAYLEPGTTWQQIQTNAQRAANVRGGPMQWVDIPAADNGPYRLEEVDAPGDWADLNLGGVLLDWMQESPMALVAGIVTRSFDVATLPKEKEGTTYIVSLPALMGLKVAGISRPDMIAPDTGASAIRDDKGQIKAVRGFVRLAP